MAAEELFKKPVIKNGNGLAKSFGYLRLLKHPDGSVRVSFYEHLPIAGNLARHIEFSSSNIKGNRATFYGTKKSLVTLDVPSIPTGKIAFDFHYDDDDFKSRTNAKEFVKTLTPFLPGATPVSVYECSKMVKKLSSKAAGPRQLLAGAATGKAKCSKCSLVISSGAIRFGWGHATVKNSETVHKFDASYCASCVRPHLARARDLKDDRSNGFRIYVDNTLDDDAIKLTDAVEFANILGNDLPNLIARLAQHRCNKKRESRDTTKAPVAKRRCVSTAQPQPQPQPQPPKKRGPMMPDSDPDSESDHEPLDSQPQPPEPQVCNN